MEIKRDYYLNKLIRKQGNGLIKLVTGIRRAGKSYLLDPIFKNYLLGSGVAEDHIIKVNLEDELFAELLEPKRLSQYIRERLKDEDKYYVLLDEIQMVPNFEAVLNGFLHVPNLDVYATGSNSRFLSTDIITEFRGRSDEVRVYPLSFQEFMSVYEGTANEGLNDYLTYGGLPLVTLAKTDEEKGEYLEAQKDNVYINDVIERNKVRNPEELTTLVEIIASSVGSLTNVAKLERTFVSRGEKNITNKTIAAYLGYLEEAFLVSKARRYDVKGKRYIDSPVKYYFVDTGIRNSLLNFRQNEPNHLMENLIYTELRRRGFKVDVGVVEKRGTDENNKKTYQQLEIDFVANKGSARYYIQSAFQINDDKKREQEVRSLMGIDDSFRKFIIMYGQFPKWQDVSGIVYLSIFDFLLDEESLEK